MKTIQRITLTGPQQSAIECSGILEDITDTDAQRILQLSLRERGRQLVVSVTCREAILEALTDLANSEDAVAQQGDTAEVRRWARHACQALSNLADRVLRLDLVENAA